jgi:hypothetical protein
LRAKRAACFRQLERNESPRGAGAFCVPSFVIPLDTFHGFSLSAIVDKSGFKSYTQTESMGVSKQDKEVDSTFLSCFFALIPKAGHTQIFKERRGEYLCGRNSWALS